MIWLLLDRTVSPALGEALAARGVRSIHASEEHFATADARGLLESAIEDECLVVTRNYADFTDLAAAFRHAGREFPGVLFLPARENGNGATPDATERDADAIAAWVERDGPETARNACCWIEPA